MREKLAHRPLLLTVGAALSIGGCLAAAAICPTQNAPSQMESRDAGSVKSLPKVFSDVLTELKARTRIPILLPSQLPAPLARAEHALINKANPDEYSISLYYELGIGDAGFGAMFAAEKNPGYSPRELPNVEPAKLEDNIRGFFREVSCGGSCAPANLWWEDDGILYQIQIELPPDDPHQKETIVGVANSAILAGPR